MNQVRVKKTVTNENGVKEVREMTMDSYLFEIERKRKQKSVKYELLADKTHPEAKELVPAKTKEQKEEVVTKTANPVEQMSITQLQKLAKSKSKNRDELIKIITKS